MSVSMRRSRDRGRREEASDGGSVRRSSSVKGRNEKSKTKEDAKSEGKQGKNKGNYDDKFLQIPDSVQIAYR